MTADVDRPVSRGRIRAGRRNLLALCTLAVAGIVMIPAGTAATNTKPFAATFGGMVTPATPATAPVQGTAGDGSVTLTLKNETKTQMLGSANVYAAATITGTDNALANTDAAQAAFPLSSGTPLELRNLNVGPGGTYTTTIYVDASPCSSFTWSVNAKQSNDFNGSGNDLTFDAGSSQTTTLNVTGCSLVWDVEPKSALVGSTISGTAYTPSAAKVAVHIQGPNGAVALSGVSVTLTRTDAAGAALGDNTPLTWNQVTTDASGVATFSSLKGTATALGVYVQPRSTGFTSPATSGPFDITNNAEICTNGVCPPFDTPLGNDNSAVQSSGNGAFTFMAITTTTIAPRYGCGNWKSVGTANDPVNGFMETEARTGTTASSKTFRVFVSQKLIQARYGKNVGQQFIPICAGGVRVDSSGAIVRCTDVTTPGSSDGGWWGESLDSNSQFTGVLTQAVCNSDGLWWGIMSSFQDFNNTTATVDWSKNPVVTGWSSCVSAGPSDFNCPGKSGATYRYFDMSVPDPWDWGGGM